MHFELTTWVQIVFNISTSLPLKGQRARHMVITSVCPEINPSEQATIRHCVDKPYQTIQTAENMLSACFNQGQPEKKCVHPTSPSELMSLPFTGACASNNFCNDQMCDKCGLLNLGNSVWPLRETDFNVRWCCSLFKTNAWMQKKNKHIQLSNTLILLKLNRKIYSLHTDLVLKFCTNIREQQLWKMRRGETHLIYNH